MRVTRSTWRREVRRSILTVCAVLLLAPGLCAETALLRNGMRLYITGYERNPAVVLLHLVGGRVAVRAEEVVAIEPDEYLSLRATPPLQLPFGELIRAAAIKYDMDEDLIASVIAAESDFNARAVSHKNARGLMQLMPATASRFAVSDPFSPQQNVEAGVRYLKELLEKYNHDLRLALAAYNAGPERVQQHRGVPPFPETRMYVKRVLQFLEQRKIKK